MLAELYMQQLYSSVRVCDLIRERNFLVPIDQALVRFRPRMNSSTKLLSVSGDTIQATCSTVTF